MYLLVDENEQRLTAVTNYLSELQPGAKCTWARNTAHALEILQYLNPGTILLQKDLNGYIALLQAADKKGSRLIRYAEPSTLLLETSGEAKAIG